MADDESYDAAWPIVSNADAIAVNQEVSGKDYGRLVAVSNKTMLQDVYHGKGYDLTLTPVAPPSSSVANILINPHLSAFIHVLVR